MTSNTTYLVGGKKFTNISAANWYRSQLDFKLFTKPIFRWIFLRQMEGFASPEPRLSEVDNLIIDELQDSFFSYSAWYETIVKIVYAIKHYIYVDWDKTKEKVEENLTWMSAEHVASISPGDTTFEDQDEFMEDVLEKLKSYEPVIVYKQTEDSITAVIPINNQVENDDYTWSKHFDNIFKEGSIEEMNKTVFDDA